MEKFKHSKYISEKDLCNKIEPSLRKYYPMLSMRSEKFKIYREFSIGPCRLDFLYVSPYRLIIFEVKLAADINSLKQLAFYKSYITSAVVHGIFNIPDHENRDDVQWPNIQKALIARVFDKEVVDYSEATETHLHRAVLKDNGDVFPESVLDHESLDIPERISKQLSQDIWGHL